MKNFIICLLFTVPCFTNTAHAQNMAINTDGSTPDASAMVDITSTSKGFLAPRMTTAQQNAISLPAKGLLIFNTTDNTFKVNTGTPASPLWTTLSASSNDWLLTGNSGSSAANNFVGTTDNVNLSFRTNNLQRMVIDTLGRTGIGASTFNVTNPEKFLVDAGTTTSVNAIVGKGNINSYLQLNIQNNSSGTSSSSDVVATANNGDETTNYVDMGINGGSNTSNVMGTANDAYLYNVGQNFLLGTGASGKALMFLTGGTDSATNERMRITGTGNVGIGNASPTQKLDITGNLRFSGALMPNNTAGTSGYLLQSAGSGAAPTWVDPATTAASTAWLQGGNTLSTMKSIGTISNQDLPFITNNTEKMRIESSGDVAIGSTTFNATNPEQLLVNAGTTTSVNAIVGKGSINNYLQLNIQNNSSGTNASSDVVATANNGSETTNYVDMGINGGSNTSNIMGTANDAYLYNVGQNFMMGTGTSGKALMFLTGGTDSATNERMRIDGTGNVGIGVTNPAYKLQVSAASNPLQLTGLQSGTNADSLLTVSNGVVKRLSPSALTTSSSNAWALIGNTGITQPAVPATYGTSTLGASENFLGTKDAKDLVLATNNLERMRVLNSNGYLGIGTSAPSKPLDIVQNLSNNGLMKLQNTSTTGYSSLDIWSNTTQIGNIGFSNSGAAYPNAFYLATNTTNSMVFATNNAERLRIDGSTGDVAIGTTTFNATNPEQLVVDAGTTTSVNAIVGKGSINNYLQLNIQNNSSGTSASSDVVATANNGSETTNYVDMGINGGSYSGGVMGSANDSYLYNQGQNFLIATATAAKSLVFMTGGTTQSTNERMRIDGSGNVGIGTNNPTSTLSVTGSHSVSYWSGTGAYTVLNTDYVIINTGGSTPTWTLPLASSYAGRVYRLINHGTTSLTLSQPVTTANGTTTTSLVNTAGSNTYEIISDGSVWRKMN